jgi:hypothetical protein
MGNIDPKDKHIHKNKHNSYVEHIFNYSMELSESRQRKENTRISVISHTIRYEVTAYKDVHGKLLKKWGVEYKGVRRVMEQVVKPK